MPLPLAHALVGATVVASLHPDHDLVRDWKPLLCGAILAVCPDFDFFFGWILHWPHMHRAFTHSIVFSVVVASVMILLMGRTRCREAVAYGLALLSHTLLDFSTTRFHEGVQLLWPFSIEAYNLGLFSFSEFKDGFESSEMLFASSRDVLLASLTELVVFLPIFVAVLIIGRKTYLNFASNRM